jgi:hypothetical protein
MPVGKMVKIGAWENKGFIGCVLFARGANQFVGREYGLSQVEICELVRIALTDHQSPVSKIGSFAVKMLRKSNPGIRLVVSYADPREGHNGAIYQAMNWVYVGLGQGSLEFFHEGRWKHNREITAGAFGKARKVADYSKLPQRVSPGKHKYLYPLDDDMRKQIEPLRKPYPKRGQGETDNAAGTNPQTEGASPI